MQKHRKTAAEKMALIQSILTGSTPFEHLRPPQSYVVYKELDSPYRLAGKELTEEEYQLWLTTLRPQDSVVVFQEQACNDPLIEDEPIVNIEPIRRPLIDQPIETPTQQTEALESPVNEPEDIPEETVLVAVPKRSGKLSEYGESWDIQHTDIFYS